MSPAWAPFEFKPDDADGPLWQRFHAYRRQRSLEHDPDLPVPPDDVAKANIRHREPTWHERRFLVADEGRIIGMLAVRYPKPESPEYEGWKHIVHAWGGVVAPARHQGVGRALLGSALEMLDHYGARLLMVSSSETDGQQCIEHLGARALQVERRSRLDLATLDWQRVDRWIADREGRAPTTTVEMYPNRLPDDILEEFCAAETTLMNLMPWDDLDHGEIVITPDDLRDLYKRLDRTNTEHHTFLSREADGTISGITDMSWRPWAPQEAHQWFTGVHPDYRGRGLGKALKATMLRFLADRHGDLRWVYTENATSNAAMLAINERLGFREHRVYKNYQLERDAVAGYLTGGGT